MALLVAALSLVLGLASDGVHHDDDLAHFLMARWAWTFPEYLLHFWGRPGFTVPAALIAGIGSASTAWHLCRALATLFTLATTLLAIDIAERLRVRPLWLVALACAAQPIAFVLSYTTLTETFAAFYLALAVRLLMASRSRAASMVFSLALVTRYDIAVLLPIWFWGLTRRQGDRRAEPWPIAALLTGWAPALHFALLRLLLDVNVWRLFSRPTGSTEYQPAGPLAYLPQLLTAIPPVVAALALVGGARLFAARRSLVPLLAGTFALTHATLKAVGLYASGGFPRFMVAVFPFVAICAVAGLSPPASSGFSPRRNRSAWLAAAAFFALGGVAIWSEHRAGRLPLPAAASVERVLIVASALAMVATLPATAGSSRARRATTAFSAGLLALTVAAQFFAFARPLRRNPAAQRTDEVLAWLRDAGRADRPIFAATPWVPYRLDLVESPRIRKSARLLASMPVGTIVLWEAIYCSNDYHRVPLAMLDGDPAYQRLNAWPEVDKRPEAILFEKLRDTPPLAEDPPSYPPDLMGTQTPIGSYYVRSAD